MICLSVTTYKKLPALRGWLDSVKDFGPVSVVHIADDNDGEAQNVAIEYQAKYDRGTYPFPIFYSTGPNKGIACNKNRGIKFFLEQTDCPYLVLSDDDIKFKRSDFGRPTIGEAFIESSKQAGIKHVTGYLGGAYGRVNEDGTVDANSDPFFEQKQFHKYGEDSNLIYFSATQGILLFFHRDIVELTGYFNEFPGRYGYEHADYSMRVNRLEGRTPEAYPIFKYSPYYFGCQGIANDYVADPIQNSQAFEKYRENAYNGVDLSRRNPGV